MHSNITRTPTRYPANRKLTDLIEDGDYLLQQHEKAVICRDANIGNAQNLNRAQNNFAEASMASSLVAIAVTMTQILEELRKMNNTEEAADEQ